MIISQPDGPTDGKETMNIIKPTKTEMAKAEKLVIAYKESGNASNRFGVDAGNVLAFAIAHFTITKASVLPTGSGDRKRALADATVIGCDWYGAMGQNPTDPTKKPSQFFEQRLVRAMAHAGHAGSWAWTQTETDGWVLSQA